MLHEEITLIQYHGSCCGVALAGKIGLTTTGKPSGSMLGSLNFGIVAGSVTMTTKVNLPSVD
jgi:hypothetical protein